MNPEHNHPTRLERIQEAVAKSRDWTISLAIHGIIVAALSAYVLVKVAQPDEDAFISEGPIINPDVSIPPAKYVESDERPEEVPPSSQTIPIPTPREPISTPISASGALPGVVMTQFPARFNISTTNTGARDVPNAVPTSVPKEYGNRFKKDGNGRIVTAMMGSSKPGSTKDSENAVLRGLNWLRDHQNPDGSWGDRYKGAMTGLALLSFLGHGEIGASQEYGLAVNKAIDWVAREGTAHQSRLSMTDGNWGPGNGGVYEHGILTYALGEYYNLTREERVLELYRKAVDYILAGQGADGGWMYNYDKTQSDTSVSGWQVQALKAAHLAKLDIPGVDAALDHAMDNFKRVKGPNGGYGYRTPSDRYSLSGVGLACRLFWGDARDSEISKGVRFILSQTKAEPVQYQHASADIYAWYYHTQAMLSYGGAAWNEWEIQFRPMAIQAQAEDGCWPVMTAPGHGKLQNDPGVTGGVYRTTFCILMLESYYRYLYLNHAEAGGGVGAFAGR